MYPVTVVNRLSQCHNMQFPGRRKLFNWISMRKITNWSWGPLTMSDLRPLPTFFSAQLYSMLINIRDRLNLNGIQWEKSKLYSSLVPITQQFHSCYPSSHDFLNPQDIMYIPYFSVCKAHIFTKNGVSKTSCVLYTKDKKILPPSWSSHSAI